MAKRILIRRDTTANWESVNPILSNGELGIEFKTDGTRSMKLGTGAIPWNSLGYFIDNPVSEADLTNHINNTSAHSATATPTANLIAMYNTDGGLKSNKVPMEVNDVLRKTELDTIDSSIDDLQTQITDLETNLATETTDRTDADADLQTQIDTLKTNLNTEITDRTDADTDLQTQIDDLETALATETTNRTDADADLQTQIDTLETALNTEITNRTNADDDLQEQIDDLETALATETTNRTDADDDLQSQIDTLETNLNTEITDRETDVANAITTAATDATTKANTAESNAKEYADDLALATQKWLAAVNTFADLLTPPPNPDQTYLCRVITGDDYGVYQWIAGGPAWTYFSDNLDFIDRIVNPVTDNIPIITANGELIDGGQSITGITNLINAKEPSKYVAVDETAAQTYSTSNPTIMVFYPEV
jgi:predicted  nucleic acid-binding Zn-ribbon protein